MKWSCHQSLLCWSATTPTPHFPSDNTNWVSMTFHPACRMVNPPPGDGGTVWRCSNRITGGRRWRSLVVYGLVVPERRRPKLIDSQPSGDSWMSPSSLLHRMPFTFTPTSLHIQTSQSSTTLYKSSLCSGIKSVGPLFLVTVESPWNTFNLQDKLMTDINDTMVLLWYKQLFMQLMMRCPTQYSRFVHLFPVNACEACEWEFSSHHTGTCLINKGSKHGLIELRCFFCFV